MQPTSRFLVALLSIVTCSTFAANFGTSSTGTKVSTAATTTTPTTTPPVSAGPQLGDSFRIVKPDGSTIIQQGNLSSMTGSIAVINVSDKDAFLASGGKCAFNVKYDESSAVAATGTTNRIYDNDVLIAQNTKIDIVPGILRSIWTQPYMTPGLNNIRLVVNADGATPSTKWIRVNVAGTCSAAASNTSTTPPVGQPGSTAKFVPGSSEWANLSKIAEYSNFATIQLKGKGYARYEELAKLNTAIVAAINAKTVDQSAYNSLMASWNTFVMDPAFKTAFAAVVQTTTGSDGSGKTSTSVVQPNSVVNFAPGSAEWKNLNNVWGYSNYAMTQLKEKGYARYDELVKLNAAIAVVINAGTMKLSEYNSLMTSWNTLITDSAFKSAMAAIVAGTTEKK